MWPRPRGPAPTARPRPLRRPACWQVGLEARGGPELGPGARDLRGAPPSRSAEASELRQPGSRLRPQEARSAAQALELPPPHGRSGASARHKLGPRTHVPVAAGASGRSFGFTQSGIQRKRSPLE